MCVFSHFFLKKTCIFVLIKKKLRGKTIEELFLEGKVSEIMMA